MAGHSQFKNIMHRKGAQDARRAKVFAKLIREITVSAKSGLPDPASNPRLRAAVTAVDSARVVVIGAGFIGAEVASTAGVNGGSTAGPGAPGAAPGGADTETEIDQPG